MFSSLTTYISTFYKKIAKDDSDRSAAMLTLSRWTATLSALVVAIVLARIIDSALFGQYAKLWMLYVLFGQVLISAFGTVSLQRIGNSDYPTQTLAQQRNISLVIALISGASLYLLAPYLSIYLQSEQMVGAIQLFSLFVAISIICSPMEAVFIQLKRKKTYLSFSIFYNIGTALVVISAFWISNNLTTTAKWMLLLPVVKAIFMYSALLQHAKRSSSNFASFNSQFSIKDEWKVSIGLGAVLFFNALLSIASHDLDRWIVASWFSNDAAFAIYAIGAKKIPFVAALTSSISAALVAHHSFKKSAESIELYQNKLHHYVNKLFVPIVLIILFSQLYAEQIISALYGAKYHTAATYFRWYQWALLGDLLFGLTAFLIANNKRQILIIASAEFLFNLLFSILLLQFYGPIGVIAATVCSHIVFSALAIFYGASIFKLSWKKYFPSVGRLTSTLFICLGLLALHYTLTAIFTLNIWVVFVFSVGYSAIFSLRFIVQND